MTASVGTPFQAKGSTPARPGVGQRHVAVDRRPLTDCRPQPPTARPDARHRVSFLAPGTGGSASSEEGKNIALSYRFRRPERRAEHNAGNGDGGGDWVSSFVRPLHNRAPGGGEDTRAGVGSPDAGCGLGITAVWSRPALPLQRLGKSRSTHDTEGAPTWPWRSHVLYCSGTTLGG